MTTVKMNLVKGQSVELKPKENFPRETGLDVTIFDFLLRQPLENHLLR